MSTWKGESELSGALQALVGGQSPSPDLIKKASQTALKFQSEYKMVVFEVEKFVKRAVAADKLSGILVMDSICKSAHSKEKDVLCARFGSRMKQIFLSLQDIPSSDKTKVSKLIEDWKKRSIFSATAYPDENELFGKVYENNLAAKLDDANGSSSSDAVAVATSAPTKRKALKLCPFREGNCPFAEKCRFNHDQSTPWLGTIPKRAKRKPQPAFSDNCSLNVYGAAKDIDLQSKELANPSFVLGSFPVELLESDGAPAELHKFHRTKINCSKPIGNATFTLVHDSLFSHIAN